MAQKFIKGLDETKGPFTVSEIRNMAASGELEPDYWIRKGTSANWKSAQSVKGIEFGTDNLTSKTSAEERATRFCPYCAEEIYTEAKKCKHCGEFLTAPSGRINDSGKAIPDQQISRHSLKLKVCNIRDSSSVYCTGSIGHITATWWHTYFGDAGIAAFICV